MIMKLLSVRQADFGVGVLAPKGCESIRPSLPSSVPKKARSSQITTKPTSGDLFEGA